jgi:hypothetical protein
MEMRTGRRKNGKGEKARYVIRERGRREKETIVSLQHLGL